MTNKKRIVGNWKMHGTPETASRLAGSIAAAGASLPAEAEIVLCPPALCIASVAAAVKGMRIAVGGQDCSAEEEGAFTGDISASMLKAVGCAYVIAGHSERRTHHRESSGDVRRKAARAMAAGLVPIICVGETAAEREAGETEAVVGRQVRESLPEEAGKSHFVLAYEPVWAIGSGRTPSADDIRAVHAQVRQVAAEATGRPAQSIEVLYGGSVKAANAKEILRIAGVAGVLVGGASLKAEEFCAIAAAAA